jgi:hypothetical protein
MSAMSWKRRLSLKTSSGRTANAEGNARGGDED